MSFLYSFLIEKLLETKQIGYSLKRPLNKDEIKVLKTDNSLMQVECVAEP